MSPRQILLALALTATTAFQSPPTRLGAVERCAPRSARGRILDELAGLDETSDDAPALAARRGVHKHAGSPRRRGRDARGSFRKKSLASSDRRVGADSVSSRDRSSVRRNVHAPAAAVPRPVHGPSTSRHRGVGVDSVPPQAPDLSAAPAKQVLEAETLFFEGPPSATELIVPGIAILTVIGIIPFAAALARQFWVKYKITSRRISVQRGPRAGTPPRSVPRR